jgi:hypothetical protein
MKKYRNTIIILFFVGLFSVLLWILYQSLAHIETFNNKVVLKNWWDANVPDPNSIELFQYLFDGFEQTIEVHSVFGSPNITREPNTIYVQFSGESTYHDPSMFDINFIPVNNEEQPNTIIYPFAAHWSLTYKINMEILIEKRILDYSKKTHFCLFAVSNGSCVQRNNFFTELSKYKKVDSCGRFMNNTGENCPDGHASSQYHNYIKKYKFMICFENVSQPNYFTEKLINAYYNETIPIYWGCPNIDHYVNMSSILYLQPNFTEQDVNNLIKEITYLDENDDAYKKKYETIFFKHGVVPDEFNLEKIKEKITQIVK